MIEIWLIEVLKGIGKFFIHPLFYFFMLFALAYGSQRVKRERSQFQIRVNDHLLEWRLLLTNGLAIGLYLSIIIVATGVVVPFIAITTFAFITLILSLTGRVRILAPTYIVGFTFFYLIFFTNKFESMSLLSEEVWATFNEGMYPSLAFLLGLLVLAEAILIYRKGGLHSSPLLIKGKRGLQVGVQEVNRLWMVPIMLLIPGSVLQAPFPWWPVFSIGEQSYALILVPFAIGFFQRSRGMLPVKAARRLGKRLFFVGIVTLIIAGLSYLYPFVSIFAVIFAIIFREIIFFRHRSLDESLPPLYSKREKGLRIVGIIPNSPADKMGLQMGESIMKVNGEAIHDEMSFYAALQKNSAHCRLEVFDAQEELRYAQRALYEGDHHELGILFVQGERKWEDNRLLS